MKPLKHKNKDHRWIFFKSLKRFLNWSYRSRLGRCKKCLIEDLDHKICAYQLLCSDGEIPTQITHVIRMNVYLGRERISNE